MWLFLCLSPGLDTSLRRKKDHTEVSQVIKDPYNKALLKDPFQNKFKQHIFGSVLTGVLLAGVCRYCLKSLRSLRLSSYGHSKNVHYFPGQRKYVAEANFFINLVLQLHLTTRDKFHKLCKLPLLLCLQAVVCPQFSKKRRGCFSSTADASVAPRSLEHTDNNVHQVFVLFGYLAWMQTWNNIRKLMGLVHVDFRSR